MHEDIDYSFLHVARIYRVPFSLPSTTLGGGNAMKIEAHKPSALMDYLHFKVAGVLSVKERADMGRPSGMCPVRA